MLKLPSTSTITPPYEVDFSGYATLEIKKITGNAADSAACTVKPINGDGAIVRGDTLQAFGTAMTAAGSNTTLGDGNWRGVSLSGYFSPPRGFMVDVAMFDLSGGSRVFRIRITTVGK